MKGFLFAFLFLAAVIYGGYSGLMALQYYLEVSNLVEEVVQRELPKVTGWGWQATDRVRRIREAIVQTARQQAIPINADAVVVTEEASILNVKVNYEYPIVKYQADKAFTIPIGTAHTFNVPDAR